MGSVKVAVIPVAGLGTRFLPATKAVPKELLPIVDKPTLQYIVEEAFASGVEHVVFVNGRQKGAIEDHFDYSYELEDTLKNRGKEAEVERLRKIADMGAFTSIRQKFPGGLGHAVLAARPIVGDQSFAVLLGDDIIRPDNGAPPAIGQLIEAHTATGKGQIALITVPREEICKYGAAEISDREENERWFNVHSLVEKPAPGTEPSDQAVIGRYCLPAEIWSALERTEPGKGGEIQLTDALDILRKEHGLMGVRFEGRRVDAGDKLGYLHANLLEALTRDDLRAPLLDVMRDLLAEHQS